MEKLIKTNDYNNLPKVDFDRVVYDEPNMKVYIETKAKYEFVDLGLSVKWATKNVGADKITDSGLYFEWGNSQGYKVTELGEVLSELEGVYQIAKMEPEMKSFMPDFSDYKWSTCVDNGGVMPLDVSQECNSFTKYNDSDNLLTLQSEDDGANKEYSKMRMPTKEECQELLDNTTIKFVENYMESGMNGGIFTSTKNGKSIFVPAAGGVGVGMVSGLGLGGGFWSSSLYTEVAEGAWLLGFGPGGRGVSVDGRFLGLPLRGVC